MTQITPFISLLIYNIKYLCWGTGTRSQFMNEKDRKESTMSPSGSCRLLGSNPNAATAVHRRVAQHDSLCPSSTEGPQRAESQGGRNIDLCGELIDLVMRWAHRGSSTQRPFSDDEEGLLLCFCKKDRTAGVNMAQTDSEEQGIHICWEKLGLEQTLQIFATSLLCSLLLPYA